MTFFRHIAAVLGTCCAVSLFNVDDVGIFAQESARKQAIQITDQCLQGIKKIQCGECIIRFRVQNRLRQEHTCSKQLNVKFEGDKSLIVGADDGRTMAYAFNCYDEETFAYFSTQHHNMLGSTLSKDIRVQDFRLAFLEILPFSSDFGPWDGFYQRKHGIDSREYSIPPPHLLRQVGMAPAITPNVSDGNLKLFFASLKDDALWKTSEEYALLDDRGGIFNLQVGEEVFEDAQCSTVSWTWVKPLVPTENVKVFDDSGKELVGQERVERIEYLYLTLP